MYALRSVPEYQWELRWVGIGTSGGGLSETASHTITFAMRVFGATVASDRQYELGEGPVWDEARERVLWVDINAGTVHGGQLDGDFITPELEMRFGETVGTVVCDADGELLVAGARRSTASSETRASPSTPTWSPRPRPAGSTTAPAIRPGASSSAAWRSTAARARSACTGSRPTAP